MSDKINKDSAMLIDIQYTKQNRRENVTDKLYIIWKDLDTNEKHLIIQEEPMYKMYFEKPEYRDHTYPKNNVPIDTTTPCVVKYKDRIYAIADDMGPSGRDKINEIFQLGNYKDLDKFYAYPYVYGADYDIRVFNRYHWKKMYNNGRDKHLRKGFMDIEVDSLESIGLPNPIINPIDLISLCDVDEKTMYTFVLTGVDYKEKDLSGLTKEQKAYEERKKELYAGRLIQQENVKNNKEKLYEEIHKEFDESYKGFKYKVLFYDSEIQMIAHFFQLVNKLKLDIIGIWNISFDIPYIIERIKALGYDPEFIIPHPDFPTKECWFKKDKNHFEIKNKTDFFHVTSYTVFVDQMVTYAAIRKGGSELRSVSLSNIARKEIGDEKLDYSDFGNIKTVSYNNFLKYIIYNIKDVLLQHGIEEATTDFDTLYLYSYENMTPYEDVFKQTVTLRCIQYEEFMNEGLIPGQNINKIFYNRDKNNKFDDDGNPIETDEDDEGFEGALVGDPTLIEHFGMNLFGRKSRSVFKYSIDLDMAAFYPNSIIAHNIDPSTLIFKVIMDASQFDVRGGKLKYHGITDVQLNKHNDDSFVDDISKECCDNLQTKNYISFGYKWLNLPSVNSVYKRMRKTYG